MTNLENQGKFPEKLPPANCPSHTRRWRFLWVSFGGTLLVGMGGGIACGWVFVQQQLAPLVEKNLANFLNRPVKLGSVESFSFNSVGFGSTQILATPEDPAYVSMEALAVHFNPFALLWQHRLELDVTAIQPHLYLEQGKNGAWLLTEFDSLKRHDIRLQVLRVKDAKFSLVARSRTGQLKAPVEGTIARGKARGIATGKGDRAIQFDLKGQLDRGGTIQIAGQGVRKKAELALNLRGTGISAADVRNLLVLPLDLQEGRIDANLNLQLHRNQLPQVQGTATLQAVKAKIPQLPQPFTEAEGQLRFQGTEVHLEGVSAHLGSIMGTARGVFHRQRGYNLTAQTAPIPILQALKSLKLQAPPVPLTGSLQAAIQVTGAPGKPNLSLDIATTEPTRIERLGFRAINAKLNLTGSHLSLTQLQAMPLAGGKIGGEGQFTIHSSQFTIHNSQFTIQEVPVTELARLYNLQLPGKAGQVSGAVQLSGTLTGKEPLQVQGTANLQLAGGTIRAKDFQIEKGRWRGTVAAADIQLAKLALPLPEGIRQGRARGFFEVAGNLKNSAFSLQNSKLQVAVAGGTLSAENLQLAGNRWTAKVNAQDIQVSHLLPALPPALRGKVEGQFKLAGNWDGSLAALQGGGKAYLTTPGGRIATEDIQFAEGNFTAALSSQGFSLAAFSPNWQGQLDGKVQVTGNLHSLNLAGIQAKGTVSASQGLGAFRQPLTAALSWNGRRLAVEKATSDGLTARGWADLAIQNSKFKIQNSEFRVAAQGLNLKALPLLLPPSIPNFDYGGKVDFAGTIAGTPQAPKIAGKLVLNGLYWDSLTWEPVLAGTIAGLPGRGSNLQLAGNHDRIELALDRSYQPLSFALQCQQINASGYRQGEEFLVGVNKLELDWLRQLAQVTVPALPPAALSQPMSGELVGQFALNLKTSALFGSQVAIANPRFGSWSGERLAGNFRYLKGKLTLTDGQLQVKNSQYALQGSLSQTPAGPHLQGEIALASGQIQDVLETLHLFDFADLKRGTVPPSYAKAADLYLREQGDKGDKEVITSPPSPPSLTPTPKPLAEIGTPQAPLLQQLQQLSQVEAILKQQQAGQKTSPLPDLEELRGHLSGKVAFTFEPASGIQAAFDWQGNAWQWGNFTFDRVQFKGNFQNGTLTLAPLTVESGKGLLAFSGRVGSRGQSGQLQLANVPLSLASNLLSLPPTLSLNGLLNATVTVGGNRENPLAEGELAVAGTKIGQMPLQKTQGRFSYRNARFNFAASSLFAKGGEPLTIAGSLPYQMPFAAIEPDSDLRTRRATKSSSVEDSRLRLRVNVRDEGLALLNILTRNEISWLGGKGAVNLDVVGTIDPEGGILRQLRADGLATVENATIAARPLPGANLTAVNGRIRFDFDHIDVESLTGKFSGGNVSAAGSLPLFRANPQQAPLTVSFDNLAFNFQELYQGGVKGKINLTGSALKPQIGGEVELFEGKFFLEEALARQGISNIKAGNWSGAAEFANLRLILAEGIQVTRSPILNFSAAGSLTLNGKFPALRPEGTIQLTGGQVNLFATLLRLAGGENTAEFFPHHGLDPYLNLRLVAAASETTPNGARLDPLSSEVNDPFTADGDSLRTVRIQARVQGFASQLDKSIELTSKPARSPQEIVTLLGGSAIATLGRGETALGLSNLAGAAVLGSVQSAIGGALGLSEFRIFTTPLIDDRERIAKTQIGVAAEAGIDLTDNLSFSVLKIVNTERPPQWGLRYRIDEHLLIRGSSNFSDDSRGAIEYERRF